MASHDWIAKFATSDDRETAKRMLESLDQAAVRYLDSVARAKEANAEVGAATTELAKIAEALSRLGVCLEPKPKVEARR